MADDIVIDKNTFHNRLSEFIAKWKNDKRSNDALFNGVTSIAICVGKASDGAYPKSAAFQVSSMGFQLIDSHLTLFAAMASRLRVPRYSLRHHTRRHSNCYYQEEG
jgi:hypothetical protein